MFKRLLAVTAIFLAFLFVACQPEDTPAPSNNNNTSVQFLSLGGSTWVLTGYHDTVMTSNMPANDTLVFIDDTHYTYNGVPCTYQYYYSNTAFVTFLYLNDTPFGDISAHVPETIETYGEINGCRFSNIAGDVYYMWFERI